MPTFVFPSPRSRAGSREEGGSNDSQARRVSLARGSRGEGLEAGSSASGACLTSRRERVAAAHRGWVNGGKNLSFLSTFLDNPRRDSHQTRVGARVGRVLRDGINRLT